MDEDPFARNAQGVGKIYLEVIILMKFLQAKPLVRNIDFNFCDLYHSVFKNRDEKEIVDNQYENDFINFNDIVPNRYNGIKHINKKLRWRNFKSD